MRYLSVCAGIEAATVAWHDLGWQPAAFSEIEPFPSAVLKHHYPDVPNVGDMTKFKEWDVGTIDLLVGGTPCQSFSVAGLRKGLDDPRGNLMLTYLAIAAKYQPRWLVWENVPGVLSSNGGKDFGTFLGALGEIGYGFAYRVLDAQYFGVAQRRRRVFVVGCLGDWRAAAAVLFERESLSGNPAPSREKGQEVAGTIAARFGISRNNHEECVATTVIGNVEGGAATTLSSREYKGLSCGRDGMTSAAVVYEPIPIDLRNASRDPEKHDAVNRQGLGIGEAGDPSHTLTSAFVHGVAQPMVLMDQGGSVMNIMQDGTVGTLRRETHGHEPVVMQPVTAAFKGGQGSGAGGIGYSEHIAPTLLAAGGGNRTPTLLQSMAVRRLTPVECERLQGFPDNYTNIPWRKQPESPDGPRYKALGNSMAVPVMAWIGRRIANAA